MASSFNGFNPTVALIEREFNQRFKLDLEALKRNWNTRIRDFLRDNLGLKLNFKEAILQQVEITFQPDRKNGLSLSQILKQEYSDLDLFKLAKLKDFSLAAENAKEWYEQDSGLANEFSLVKAYAEQKSRVLNVDKLLKQIIDRLMKESKNDVFGGYFIQEHRIQIYYVPCIIFAQIHKINVQSFCVMVLAHELAHAYHHIGYDPDGKQWNNFQQTDDKLAESLAQFYTCLFAEKYSSFNTGILTAFNKLLEYQSEPYTIFNEWKYKDRRVSVSSVNAALNECRRNDVKDYSKFKELLEEYTKRLR